MPRHRFLVVALSGIVLAQPAHAELNCEQLVASAQAAIAMRDQGASLRTVLAEADKPEVRERFRPDELVTLRRAIQLAYTGEISVHELSETCLESQGGGRRR